MLDGNHEFMRGRYFDFFSEYVEIIELDFLE